MRFGWDFIAARRGLLSLLVYFLSINLLIGLISPLFTPLVLDNWDARTLGVLSTIMGAGMLAAGSSGLPAPAITLIGESTPLGAGVGMLMQNLVLAVQNTVDVRDIGAASAAANCTIAELPFPPEASVMLVVRGDDLIAPRGTTLLTPGDHVYVLCHPEDRAFIGLLLGRSENE